MGLLYTLVALAFMTRALVPAGWMPVADAAGIQLVLCGGNGPLELQPAGDAHAEHHGHHAQPGDARASQDEEQAPAASGSCAFAASPAMPSPAGAANLAPIVRPNAPITVRTPVTFVGRGLAAPPPPATGPPLPA